MGNKIGALVRALLGFCNNDGSAGLLWHLWKTVNVNGHKYTTVVEIQDTRTGLNLCM